MSDRPSAGPLVASLKDFGGPVARWRAELDLCRHEFYDWWKLCERIEKVYRNDKPRRGGSPQQFAVFWSNIETLKPAIYSRPPIPVVARTFGDADPVGRAASMILRRTIQQEQDAGKLDRRLKQVRDDYLMYGRGTLWARYEAQFAKPAQITEDAEEAGERVEEECVAWDFVRRDDFLHASAPDWDSVTWTSRRVRMTQPDGVDRFGKKFLDVPLSFRPDRAFRSAEDTTYDVLARAVVYEIWDKRTRKVIWIADGYDEVLDERDDPLGLSDFFPCPRPLFGTMTDSTLVPVPDYQEYQAQIEQLDDLTRRIRYLTKAIKAAGVYDAQYPEIKRLFQETNDNELVPVRDWSALAQRGGLTKAIELLPMLEMAQTLETLINARAQVKSDLYEITGISDVIRGAETTSGDKTATEIRTKGRYATLRLSDRQLQMAEFVRDVLRMTAEIIAEHFSPETLIQSSNWAQSEMAQGGQPPMPGMMPGQAMFDAAMALLRNDRLRGFRIDVEDKSTIAVDEEAEKVARVQFLEAVGGFIQQSIAVPADLAPVLAPALGKMLLFGVRGFPIGLELETMLEDTVQKMQQHLEAKAQQPPQPTPEMLKAQADVDRMKLEGQIKHEQAQAGLQIENMKAQAMQAKSQADLAIAQMQLQIKQLEAQMMGMKLNTDAAQAEAQNAQDLTEHVLTAQSADLAAVDQEHQHTLDWAKLAVENRKVDVAEEAAEARETEKESA